MLQPSYASGPKRSTGIDGEREESDEFSAQLPEMSYTESIYSPCSMAQYELEGKDKKAQGQGGVERVNWWYGVCVQGVTRG
jgi:hypothetical protein